MTKEKLLKQLIKGKEMKLKWKQSKESLDNFKDAKYSFSAPLILAGILGGILYFIFSSLILSGIIAFVSFIGLFTFIIKDTGPRIEVLEKEIKTLENNFKFVCGFPIHQYSLDTMNRVIKAMRNGEADTLKEALEIDRQDRYHRTQMEAQDRLLNENKKLQQQIIDVETNLTAQNKKLRKENSGLKDEIERIRPY
ncbi:hypothetical protein [Rossellomorea aquimaris]|uniref:hypothetical protein n=1 Tax=Rossellomorea aquimaris TaxID=189382 RepID=UPI0005CB3BF3|nr:hypothetical protein [Rossellomorea aquimaris]